MSKRSVQLAIGLVSSVLVSFGAVQAVSTATPARPAVPLAPANSPAAALRARALDLAYNLDQQEAQDLLDEALAADPDDPATHRAVATVTWLSLLFRRGVVTVDDYLGHLDKQTLPVDRPPAALATRFTSSVERALALGERLAQANPGSADAHYHVGAAIGLLASYKATAEGQVLGGIRAARRAYSEHERVLEIAPSRSDAKLTVGTYRYVVSMMPLPLRMMAYMVGFGGGRERGLQMIEEAAAHPSEAQQDARFALVLLYNREGRYEDAMRVIATLQALFPRNRLLWLEAGATALRAGDPRRAEAILSEGIARLQDDARPRCYGEMGAWHYKRGAARVRLGNRTGAAADLQTALRSEARNWVRGRAHMELGKLADLAGDRTTARAEYEAAIRLTERDNDPAGAAEARAYLRAPYARR